jgi:hypothetical protein
VSLAWERQGLLLSRTAAAHTMNCAAPQRVIQIPTTTCAACSMVAAICAPSPRLAAPHMHTCTLTAMQQAVNT